MVERITKRKVSSNSNDTAILGIGSADLDELGIEPGDEVKVITQKDEIKIRSVESE